MATYYEEVEITRKEKIVVYVECDWCREEIDAYEKIGDKEYVAIGGLDVEILSTDLEPNDDNLSWEIENLCVHCWIKLKDTLTKLGVKCVDNRDS